MKNLNQIRAANAIAHRGSIANSQNDGDAISGFPTLIRTNGLLAALAFALEEKEVKPNDLPNGPPRQALIGSGLLRSEGNDPQKKWFKRKHPGEYTIARAISSHLNTQGIGITTEATPDALINELARENDDLKLRRATAEAIPFLSYLKRFVA